MASAIRLQVIASARVRHLPAEEIQCRFCGESSASGSFKGYAHRFGPHRGHRFIAAKPRERSRLPDAICAEVTIKPNPRSEVT